MPGRLLVQRLRSARQYIWEMDLYPGAAIDLRVFRAESPAARAMGAVADFARRRDDDTPRPTPNSLHNSELSRHTRIPRMATAFRIYLQAKSS